MYDPPYNLHVCTTVVHSHFYCQFTLCLVCTELGIYMCTALMLGNVSEYLLAVKGSWSQEVCSNCVGVCMVFRGCGVVEPTGFMKPTRTYEMLIKSEEHTIFFLQT